MTPYKGPISYRNWKAALAMKPSTIAYEYPLFTDSHITGEIVEGYGPYQFLNTIPIFRPTVAPSIVLRVSNHIPVKDVIKVEMGILEGHFPYFIFSFAGWLSVVTFSLAL